MKHVVDNATDVQVSCHFSVDCISHWLLYSWFPMQLPLLRHRSQKVSSGKRSFLNFNADCFLDAVLEAAQPPAFPLKFETVRVFIDLPGTF